MRTQLGGGDGGILGFGGDQGYFVALEAHDVAAERGLIGVDQAVGVEGHVGGGEDGDDAGIGQRGGGVERADARVDAMGKDDLQVQHAGTHEVGGIARRRR